ncbi:unannotated protein [freshwater metagenome]|uniref:Unannotated protein n=1 Tax=freshwater metagenome TaxID=449393 RepID=A0A6J7J0N3_9ZZZZ
MSSPAADPDRTASPVVAAVDGSAASMGAVHAAAGSAQRLGVPLRLVRVVPQPGDDPGDQRAAHVEFERAVQQLDEARRTVVALLPALPVNAVVRRGRAAHELQTESVGAAQVVLGEHTGPGLGLVAGELARRTASPLLLHRTVDRPTGPVVVGLDCLPGTETLLEVAAEEAHRRGTALHVLHGRMSRTASSLVLAAEQRLLERLADRARGDHHPLQVHVQAVATNATTLLLTAAADAQVLVLGRRTPGARRRTSSTGSSVLLRAACPVLLVPGPLRGEDGTLHPRAVAHQRAGSSA